MSGSAYPGSIDSFPDPSPSNNLSDPTVLHSTQHANLNDAVNAIETTLGVNPQGSASTVGGRFALYVSKRPEIVDIRDAAPSVDLSGVADAVAALNTAIAALPAGAQLSFPAGATVNVSSGSVNIANPIVMQARGVTFTDNGTTPSFNITSPGNGSKFYGGSFVGNKPTTYSATHYAFFLNGSPTAWVDSLRFEQISVNGYGYGGWFGNECSNITIIEPRVTNSVYVGIQLLSAAHVLIKNLYVNTLQGITAGSYQQSYPVAFTRDQTQSSITSYPNSIDCEVNGAYIANTGWEACDTHGGQDIRFIDIETHNCLHAVAAVPCPNQAGNDTWGPKDILIQGLRAYGPSDGSAATAVHFVGAGVAGGRVDAATGIISDVMSYGIGPGPVDPSSLGGALQLYQTQGVIVRGARIIQPSHFGISLYYDNQDMILDDLYVEDVWSSTFANCAAIGVRNAGNTVTLGNIRAANQGNKTSATYSNALGLYVSVSTRNKITLAGSADFTQMATAIAGGTTGVVRRQNGTNSIAIGSSLPVNGVWVPGDQWQTSAPAASTSPGSVCVTGGASSSTTWAASTAYAAGVWVAQSGGQVMECTIAGTSGTTAPTVPAVGATVVDGTVTWTCRATNAVAWKSMPALGA